MLSENPEDVILEVLSEIHQAEADLVEMLACLRSGRKVSAEHSSPTPKPGGTVIGFTARGTKRVGTAQIPLKNQEKRRS
jgi:hypothetical protein